MLAQRRPDEQVYVGSTSVSNVGPTPGLRSQQPKNYVGPTLSCYLGFFQFVRTSFGTKMPNQRAINKIGFDKRFIDVFRGLDISQISEMFRSIPFCSVF